MPVRTLILSPPILVRALCSDPAHLLVHAGGGAAAARPLLAHNCAVILLRFAALHPSTRPMAMIVQ